MTGIPVDIDPGQVKRLAEAGLSVVKIAEILGVSRSTLYERFRTDLDKGREDIHHSLRAAQIRLALQGNATMLIWLGKQLLGQVDRKEVELGGEVTIIPYVPSETQAALANPAVRAKLIELEEQIETLTEEGEGDTQVTPVDAGPAGDL